MAIRQAGKFTVVFMSCARGNRFRRVIVPSESMPMMCTEVLPGSMPMVRIVIKPPVAFIHHRRLADDGKSRTIPLMVSPEAKRSAVAHMQQENGTSERRACGLVGQPRSTEQYQAKSKPEDTLPQRIAESLFVLTAGDLLNLS